MRILSLFVRLLFVSACLAGIVSLIPPTQSLPRDDGRISSVYGPKGGMVLFKDNVAGRDAEARLLATARQTGFALNIVQFGRCTFLHGHDVSRPEAKERVEGAWKAALAGEPIDRFVENDFAPSAAEAEPVAAVATPEDASKYGTIGVFTVPASGTPLEETAAALRLEYLRKIQELQQAPLSSQEK